MSFHEEQFPPDISYGSKGGPGFMTTVIEVDSGSEQRIARWANARHQYDVAYGVKRLAQLTTLKAFFMARQGAAYGFRYKDWLDYTTAPDHRSAPMNTDCLLGVGDGVRTIFQLQKKYVSGATTAFRALTKPVAGTVVVAKDTVNETSFSTDTTNGEVTFAVAPALGVVVTGGCQFDVPVRFAEDADKLLSASIDSFDEGSMSIPLVEIKDSTPVDPTGSFAGGACETATHTSLNISLGKGRVQVVSALASGLKVRLPDPATVPTGGPLFYVINAGPTNTFDIVSYDEVTTYIAALGVDQGVEVILSVDGAGNRIWYVF